MSITTYQAERMAHYYPTLDNFEGLPSTAGQSADFALAALNGKNSGLLQADFDISEGNGFIKILNSEGFKNVCRTKSSKQMYRIANLALGNNSTDTSWVGANSALVVITNWGGLNIGDYELLVFDEDGFKINNFKNSTFYMVNSTLYIVMKYCCRYKTSNTEVEFSNKIHVVFAKKFLNPSVGMIVPKFLINDIWNTQVFSDISLVPSQFSANMTAMGKFKEYPANNYQLVIELGSWPQVTVADYITDFPLITEIDCANINILLHNSSKFEVIPFNKFSYSKTGDVLIITPVSEVESILDLGIEFDMNYNIGNSYFHYKLRKLSANSRFYIINKATGFSTEFEYKRDVEVGSIPYINHVSANSDLKASEIEKAMTEDGVLQYIPLISYYGDIFESDDLGEEEALVHSYPVVVDKAEDIAFWYDGVKMTPYLDYLIVNRHYNGREYPVSCIVWSPEKEIVSNSEDEVSDDSIAAHIPTPSLGSSHFIKVFKLPPKTSDSFSNIYIGPEKNDFFDIYNTKVEDKVNILEHNGQNLPGFIDKFYPFIAIPEGSALRDNRYRLSALVVNSLMMFHGGRFVYPSKLAYRRIVTDYIAMYENMKTCFNIELYSYFDPSIIDAQFIAEYEATQPYIENLLTALNVQTPFYAFIAAYYSTKFPEIAEQNSHYIIYDEDNAYGNAREFIADVDSAAAITPIEQWLKLNANLAYRSDNSSDASVRFPDTIQTSFDASFDLHNQGFQGNISVDASNTEGLAARTETSNTESEEP